MPRGDKYPQIGRENASTAPTAEAAKLDTVLQSLMGRNWDAIFIFGSRSPLGGNYFVCAPRASSFPVFCIVRDGACVLSAALCEGAERGDITTQKSLCQSRLTKSKIVLSTRKVETWSVRIPPCRRGCSCPSREGLRATLFSF